MFYSHIVCRVCRAICQNVPLQRSNIIDVELDLVTICSIVFHKKRSLTIKGLSGTVKSRFINSLVIEEHEVLVGEIREDKVAYQAKILCMSECSRDGRFNQMIGVGKYQ